MSYFNQVKF